MIGMLYTVCLPHPAAPFPGHPHNLPSLTLYFSSHHSFALEPAPPSPHLLLISCKVQLTSHFNEASLTQTKRTRFLRPPNISHSFCFLLVGCSFPGSLKAKLVILLVVVLDSSEAHHNTELLHGRVSESQTPNLILSIEQSLNKYHRNELKESLI